MLHYYIRSHYSPWHEVTRERYGQYVHALRNRACLLSPSELIERYTRIVVDDFKTTHIDADTGAKVSTIYQNNGWTCEVWEYPDGTRDEIFYREKELQ